ncbi:flavin reductase [Rhodococcus sp. G-MC3]|uniref:flavin reductase n=1 Tax=Rhodococcus sp. G-MC3 TaxID=3046209 RepID=UPI0024BA45B1|nr:flavin reductase [Rhodococcus sp. G-MC3]MDJ0396263.1 flavin reductase [Rhodococcus sp. G-MC3]
MFQPTHTRANSPVSVSIDSGHYRRVLGHYPTGVCVITAIAPDGKPVGMTVGSFTSVSLDPPLVAFLAMKTSRAFSTIVEVGRFAVNVLAGDQLEQCRKFASRENDKFNSVAWRLSPLGSPVLLESPAWIDCTVESVIELGDHAMVVGAVSELDVERSAAPLMYFQGGYGRFSALSMVIDTADELSAHLRLADLARPKLEEISRAFGVHAAANALVGEHVVQLAWVGADGLDLETNLVGLRLPFVAPFGLLFAAWQSDEEREAWLGESKADELVRQILLDDLEQARQQGWAVIPDHAILREIEASIARIATDGALRASLSELETQIVKFAHQYTALSRDRPRGLSVPVFDNTGHVVLTVTAQRLPQLSPRMLDQCRAALVSVGEELTRAIGGLMPPIALDEK